MAHLMIGYGRRSLAIAALCSLVALVGCSGEIDGPPNSGAPGASGAPSGASLPPAGATEQALPGAGSGATGSSAPGESTTMVPADAPPAETPTMLDGEPGTAEMTPAAPQNPGTVIARRLNHAEYNNTVRDLLGTELRPADDFLADDPGAGFDTVGAAASLSPAYVRDYEAAARSLVNDLFADSVRLSTIVTCDVEAEGEACARAIITEFASKAFRRPPTSAEVDVLLTPYTTAISLGAGGSEGVRHSLIATLISPHFIFKLEIDPDPTSTSARRLNDYELATRLSYALWSTMPDEELRSAADAGTLVTDDGLSAQIDRMLVDPKIEALADNFASQWLDFRRLHEHEVDTTVFRGYDPALAPAMQEEAKLFFMEFLTGGHTIRDMLVAPFTFVDGPLAEYYGLESPGGAFGAGASQVDTTGTERAGLLTLGAFLTSTSYSTRTSPVRRGQFVMDRFLCTEVPPPPPEIEGLTEDEGDGEVRDGLTLRERMEQHRQDPACLGCHQLMDPIGFGLESFDGVGRFRTMENGVPIDSTGELDGVAFSGATDLAAILADDPRFVDCVTEKFMTFALGRFLNQPDDHTWIRHIAGTTNEGSGTMPTMLRTLLLSEAFRSRQPTL